MKNEPHIHGSVKFRSNLEIEEVGRIISEKIFSGLAFGGKEENIYEEIPAIYINNLMLGFQFVIQGFSGLEKSDGFSLDMIPYFSIKKTDKFKNTKSYDVNLNNYLYALLDTRLKGFSNIILEDPDI